jgi:hypothetical protein
MGFGRKGSVGSDALSPYAWTRRIDVPNAGRHRPASRESRAIVSCTARARRSRLARARQRPEQWRLSTRPANGAPHTTQSHLKGARARRERRSSSGPIPGYLPHPNAPQTGSLTAPRRWRTRVRAHAPRGDDALVPRPAAPAGRTRAAATAVARPAPRLDHAPARRTVSAPLGVRPHHLGSVLRAHPAPPRYRHRRWPRRSSTHPA